MNIRKKGITAAISSALFLGISPIFGKQSFLLGFSPLAVVAIRTLIAVILLFLFLVIFKSTYFRIYPVGLIGCTVAGVINGLGSIFYYSALARLDASIGQLIYSFYPLFVALWLILDRQVISKITMIRLILVVPGVFLLVSSSTHKTDLIGAGMMVVAAILYALHLLINQRILYDAPAPTVTFYTLLAMSTTVLAAYLIFIPTLPPATTSWAPVIFLGLITFISRISLFLGVKHLGGLQTALIGLGELLITVALAHLFLAERLTALQWLGAILIAANIFLVSFDKPVKIKSSKKGIFSWLNPPANTSTDIPFQG